ALLRPRGPQHLDDARTHAAATVDREPGRLVDDEQVLVLEEHGERAGAPCARRRGHPWRGRGGLDPQGRYADRVAGLEARVGPGPATVDPHLAITDHAMEMAARDPAALAGKEIVQSLADGAFVHRHHPDGGGPLGRPLRPDFRSVRGVSVM